MIEYHVVYAFELAEGYTSCQLLSNSGLFQKKRNGWPQVYGLQPPRVKTHIFVDLYACRTHAECARISQIRSDTSESSSN